MEEIILNPREPLNTNDLVEFEEMIGNKFPNSFTDMLKQYNGGYLDKGLLRFSEGKEGINGTTLGFFYGFGGYSENISSAYSNLKNTLPKNFVPFGSSGGGDQIMISLRDDASYGKIYYWIHDIECPDIDCFNETKNRYPKCIIRVAESFDELLGMLEDE